MKHILNKRILPPVPHKNWLKRIAYRWLRNDMVARMRKRGDSWARINRMLETCGQYQIKSAQYDEQKGGIRIIFYCKKDFKPKALPDFKHIPEPQKTATI